MSQTLEAYLLAALLISVALGIVITFLILWRRMPRNPASIKATKEAHDWPTALLIVVLMMAGFSWLDSRDAKVIAELEAQGQIRKLMNAGYLHPDRAWFKANLNDCPPRTDGMTDKVVMVITTEADGKHKAEGCSRIAHRQYIVKPLRKPVQG